MKEMGYWVLDGKTPVYTEDIAKWGEMYRNNKENSRKVAKDDVGDVHISTVFLGIDHRFGDEGPPLLFETMIFGGEHDEYQERYSTWEEAEEGHERALKLVKGL